MDAFQAWLPRVEAESGYSIKMLRVDNGSEFISAKLRLFCKKRGISIKYTVPYIHKKNRLAEQGCRTIIIIKDSILIDSGLLNRF